LNNRSLLLQSGNPLTVERFGAFYQSKHVGRSSYQAKRGRRSEIDWERLKGRLSEMLTEGSVPDGKESCIYEIIVFAEKELGKTPSRTAVQRNLSAELDAIYARN